MLKNNRKKSVYTILWLLLFFTIGIIIITLFLYPIYSGILGLIWNKIILPFEMALFPTVFVYLGLHEFLHQEKKKNGKISFTQKIITLLGCLCCIPWCLMIFTQEEGPIHAISDLIKGPVTESLSFSSIHYQRNYNHIIYTKPYFNLWLLKSDSSANYIILKLENRNSRLIEPLSKKFIINNTVWNTQKILESFKEDSDVSIYSSELDIQDIPDIKVTYYPRSMVFVSIECD